MRTLSTALIMILALVLLPMGGHAQDDTEKVEALGAPDYEFVQMDITITAGTTVEWVNVGSEYHTITANETGEDGEPIFDGEVMGDNDTFSHTFDEPGTFDYYCGPHLALGMVGTVTVQADGGNTNDTDDGATGGDGDGDDEDAPAPGAIALLVAVGLVLVAYRRR